MEGTELLVTDVDGKQHEADIEDINLTVVYFTMDGKWSVEDIIDVEIVRGGEQMSLLNEHMRIGFALLTNPQSKLRRSDGSAFSAPVLGLGDCRSLYREVDHLGSARVGHPSEPPTPSTTTGALHSPTESLVAARFKPFRGLSGSHLVNQGRQHAALVEVALEAVQADRQSERYLKLNAEQKEVAESKRNLNVCSGYPGTGKTQALSGLVLNRFQHLLELPAGWMVCLSNTNFSAIAMVKQISAFASLRPFLKHGFSEVYRAFHPMQFVRVSEFKMKDKSLAPHGILVCTVGKLKNLLATYPGLGDIVFDLVTDESGLIWDFNSLLFLPPLRNLARWYMFGDMLQLCPYVTRLATKNIYFSSVMMFLDEFRQRKGRFRVEKRQVGHLSKPPTPIPSDSKTESHIRLRVQYRMNTALCTAHAPLFYDYTITTARTQMCNPDHDGLHYVQLPSELKRGESFQSWGVRRALEIYEEIMALDLRTEDGTPYSVTVVTPYVATAEAIRMKIKEARQDHVSVPLPMSASQSRPPTPHDPVAPIPDAPNVFNMDTDSEDDDVSQDLPEVAEAEMLADATDVPYSRLCVSTIDSIQGCEDNVVILLTITPKIADLLKCRHRANVATSRARDMLVVIMHEKCVMSKETTPTGDRVRVWGRLLRSARPWAPTLEPNAAITLAKLAAKLAEEDQKLKTAKPSLRSLNSSPASKAPPAEEPVSNTSDIRKHLRDLQRSMVSTARASPSLFSRGGHGGGHRRPGGATSIFGGGDRRGGGRGGRGSRGGRGRGRSARPRPTTNRSMTFAQGVLNSSSSGADLDQGFVAKELLLKRKPDKNQAHNMNLFAKLVHCSRKDFLDALRVFAEVRDFAERNGRLREMFGLQFKDAVSEETRELVAGYYK